MKPRRLLFLLCPFTVCTVSLFARNGNEPADTSNRTLVPVAGNTYIYPDARQSGNGMIEDDAVQNWSNAAGYNKTFFLAREKGQLWISLQLPAQSAPGKLSIGLEGSGKTYTVNVQPSDKGLTSTPVGPFVINDTLYHAVVVKGISKTGNYFPVMNGLVLSGSAAKNIIYNKSTYRGAPATHLNYTIPGDSAAAWFYTEVNVPAGVNAVNAYYETNGFSEGYAGVQVNSATERRFIFSVWSSYRTDDPSKIPADYAVKLLKKGKNVYGDQFGNEGSGGHSHLVFPWKNGNTYKILLHAEPAAGHTVFTAWFNAPENGGWQLLAQWDKLKASGHYFTGLYAFVENFGENGNDFFKACYGNQWICTPSGNWVELTQARFTTTANPAKHQVYNYGTGTEDNRFYMYSGGFSGTPHVVPQRMISRKPNGKAPGIDFTRLPTE